MANAIPTMVKVYPICSFQTRNVLLQFDSHGHSDAHGCFSHLTFGVYSGPQVLQVDFK